MIINSSTLTVCDEMCDVRRRAARAAALIDRISGDLGLALRPEIDDRGVTAVEGNGRSWRLNIPFTRERVEGCVEATPSETDAQTEERVWALLGEVVDATT